MSDEEELQTKAQLMAGGASVGGNESFRRILAIVWILAFIVLAVIVF
jgi:hypothetical protein